MNAMDTTENKRSSCLGRGLSSGGMKQTLNEMRKNGGWWVIGIVADGSFNNQFAPSKPSTPEGALIESKILKINVRQSLEPNKTSLIEITKRYGMHVFRLAIITWLLES